MRVVALVPGGIGDQILFFPTLDGLKRNYPDTEIDVVVEPQSKAAYRVSRSVNDVFAFDYTDRNSPADWANLLGILRDRYYDVAITTRSTWGIGLLLWLTGIANRIGYSNGGGTVFLTQTVPFKADQNQANAYYDLLEGLGGDTSCPDLTLTIPKSDLDWAEAEQKRLGVSNYVLIHDGLSFAAKSSGTEILYPIESWQQVIQDFQQRQPDLAIVLAQGGADQAWAAELVKACPSVKVTRPGDVGKLAAMIAAANLLISTESAPLHLAVALQVYTLALLGKTDPAQLLPANDKFQSVQAATGRVADISPAQVMAKVWGE